MNARRKRWPPGHRTCQGHDGRHFDLRFERWLSRFLNFLGSPNWVSTTHVCNWHKDTGFTYTFGVEIPTPTSRTVIFFCSGAQPELTSLILAHDIVAARKRGMKIVAVDPRRVGSPAKRTYCSRSDPVPTARWHWR